MSPNPSLISVTNLGRQLAQHWLWRGVSFELRAGDCLGLVGPSGIGKTLLLRNLVLLDPIHQGQITWAGRPLVAGLLPHYRTQVIYLPQRAIPLAGTVEANLKQVFDLAVHRQKRYDRSRLLTWLEQLGRGPDFLNLQASQLSGGETQILALVRALQLDPLVLLLDEPTASLDPDSTARVEALLHQWRQVTGRAYLITSHDRAQIDRVSTDRLALQEFH